MARFNRFGATAAQVIALYPGTVAADYDDGGASGTTRIEAVLDRIAREVAAAFTPEVYTQITQVDAEWVTRYATSGQTTATLGLTPVVAGTVHLWRYPLITAGGHRQSPQGWTGDAYFRKPEKAVNEIATTDYTVNATTGAISLTGTTLALGERLYATYDVDVDAATFAMQSVGDIVILGAAAELGAKLYSVATQEWKLVDEYKERYRGRYVVTEGGFKAAILSGGWVPDELRKLNYWNEVERTSEQVSSVRLYRG